MTDEPKTERHPGVDSLLHYFEYEHLSFNLQAVSRPFGELANRMAGLLPDTPELTVCLRKLLEAKDCVVRAAVDVTRDR